ncbi:MAG: 5'/3'-nucleotidase SurE [Desulfovibrionaceae bacterium]|jgi:5'-nucleotidase|nr:5'/3'-nucleotidase SurE [Desulfovibrionaceae bacterium]
MRILLTNDDGIQALGLRALDAALRAAGHHVTIVAPVTEQSAVGHAVTLSMPLRVKLFKDNGFSGSGVYGTPVDCVKLALTALIDARPELVVSGINAGCNVGVDIVYSGTVSAATEGALAGVHSLAVSYDDFNPTDLSEQAAYAARLLARLDFAAWDPAHVLNLNFPARPMAETLPLRVCPHTPAAYRDVYDRRTDPRGRTYYWLTGEIPTEEIGPDTDKGLLNAGHVTLTPLKLDFTAHRAMAALRGLEAE